MTPLDSRESFEALFLTLSEPLRRMAFFFLHDEAAAEDVVQETFSRGLASRHTFRSESRPEVWLYSIGLNVCRQACRRSRRQEAARPDPAAEDAQRHPGHGPLTSVLRREAATRLAIALGYLTDLQREVFVLHYVEELPYDEIALLLDVSAVGARGLARRAKQKLREKVPPGYALPGD